MFKQLVDAEEGTAWVQSGATIGKLYYRIAEKSPTFGFPAAIFPTESVGGHFSGGGYGTMLRKYSLAADNVINAQIVDVNGRTLNRESMGEGLFGAIRGGGGGSFGTILSWKVKLVSVPPTVTVFAIEKTLEQGEKTILASFHSMFLGGAEKLLTIMKERFPALGLESTDCREMTWIQSVLYFAVYPVNGSLDVLLSRTEPRSIFKAKSDYVKEPISQIGLEQIWRRLLKRSRLHWSSYLMEEG
ncbi:FAD linked oxidase [Macleaya cordata]|uniref:FAD linked oxidase n=1 Tax=Macleaya cordata TaxID=56857 RepID=A0A200Q0J3_MACCD|nr:FAD linked oxidase [Macleaya cordata]